MSGVMIYNESLSVYSLGTWRAASGHDTKSTASHQNARKVLWVTLDRSVRLQLELRHTTACLKRDNGALATLTEGLVLHAIVVQHGTAMKLPWQATPLWYYRHHADQPMTRNCIGKTIHITAHVGWGLTMTFWLWYAQAHRILFCTKLLVLWLSSTWNGDFRARAAVWSSSLHFILATFRTLWTYDSYDCANILLRLHRPHEQTCTLQKARLSPICKHSSNCRLQAQSPSTHYGCKKLIKLDL